MGNTYTYPRKEDVEIIVGDEKQEAFFPRMKIKRWDNEVNFSVGIVSTHEGSDINTDGNVEWNDGHGIKARFYEKHNDEFEFEIELADKPKSNVLNLSIETKGLRFLYQPELTEKESAINPKTGRPRCTRPENVVGSYAVYHQTMKGNYIGGKNYRAGKAFHIYRPFVTDANGNREWCEIDITAAGINITIPDSLVYPIVIDPTFGVNPENPGGSWSWDIESDMATGSLFTSPSNIDTAQSITTYLRKDVWDDDYNVKGLIVLHSNLNIISNGIGGVSSLVTSTTGGWITSTFGTDPSPSISTEYVLMVISNNYGRIAFDSGDANQGHVDTTNSYTSPVNLGTAIHTNEEFSIYCTYTAAVAEGISRPKINGGLVSMQLVNGGLIS